MGDGFLEERDGGGVVVEVESGAEEGEDGAVVESRISEGTEEVDADAEGVDIVHSEVAGDHVGEDKAAKDKGEDGDADACCGGEDPDEEYEGADAEAEHGGNVDFGEHVAILPVETLV